MTPEQRASAMAHQGGLSTEKLIAAATSVTVPPETKPKRTRRTKAQMELAAKDAAAPPMHVEMGEDTYVYDAATISPPATIPVPPPVVPYTYPSHEGFTLYLDCAPEGRNTLRASDLYGKVNAGLQASFNASNFRLIKFEGPGLFVAGFTKLFDEAPQDIIVDTRTAEGLLVLESLRARAGMVVR